MQVKIVNTSHHPLPKYETSQSAGMDLRAFLPEGPITLKPMERGLVKTGLFMELPAGYEAQVRPRSGLALKKGITVLCIRRQSSDPKEPRKMIIPQASDVIEPGDRLIVFGETRKLDDFS